MPSLGPLFDVCSVSPVTVVRGHTEHLRLPHMWEPRCGGNERCSSKLGASR